MKKSAPVIQETQNTCDRFRDERDAARAELAAVSRDAKVKALQLEAQVRPRRMFVIMSDSKGGKCVCVGA